MYKRRGDDRNPHTVGSMNRSHTVPSMNKSHRETHNSEINKRLEGLKEKNKLYQCEYCSATSTYEDVLQHEKTCKSRPKPELDPTTQGNAEQNHKLKEMDPKTPQLIRKVIQVGEIDVLPPYWGEYVDGPEGYDTGKTFYWNSETEESTEDRPPHFHAILSISGINITSTSKKQEIKKAYHILARKVHPDHNEQSTESQKAFQILRDASARLTEGSQGGGKNRYPSKKSRKKKKKRKSSNKRGLTNKRKSSNKRGMTNKRKSSKKR